MKKILAVLIIVIVLAVTVRAAPEVDTDKLDSALDGVEHYSFFGGCGEILKAISENKFTLDGKSITDNLLKVFFGSLKKSLSELSVLLGICIILSLAENLKIISPEAERAAFMGGRVIFACALVASLTGLARQARQALQGIASFTQVLTPILISLLACTGAKGSVKLLSPTAALLSTLLVRVSSDAVMPLIISGAVTSFTDGILGNGKLKGIADLLKSCASFLLGGIFTVFSAITAIGGVAASAIDGISVRGIKYALSASVPIIGGTVSESLSAVLASGALIKSAVGVIGIISVAGIIILPLINIYAYILSLKLLTACVNTFAGNGFTLQLSNACEFLKLTAILLLGVGVLWFVYLGIIIGAGSGVY